MSSPGKIEYTFDKEQGILFVKFSGKLKIADTADYAGMLHAKEGLPDHLKILYDFTEVELDLGAGDVRNAGDYTRQTLSPYETVKSAFITEVPRVAALTEMFCNAFMTANTTKKVFTTREAALEWLNIS